MPIPNSGMDALKTIDQFCGASVPASAGTLASLVLQSSLAGLVVFAERLNPNPSRTRPLNFPAPMVLSLKAWKSRSLPGLPRTLLLDTMIDIQTAARDGGRFLLRKSGPRIARRPERGDAATKRLRLLGEQAAGKPLGRRQVCLASCIDHGRESRPPWREGLVRGC